MSIQLQLVSKDLKWLGQAFEKNSIISPFSFIKGESFTSEDKKALLEKGIIDEKDEIKKEYLLLFKALSEVEEYVKVDFYSGPVNIKKLVFYSKDQSISYASSFEDVYLEMPANTDVIAEYLSDYMGSSGITNADLTVDLNYKTSLVLSIIFDIYRKEILKSQISDEEFKQRGIQFDEILENVSNLRNNEINLAYYIHQLTKSDDQLEISDVKETIEILTDEKIVFVEDGKIYLLGESAYFGGAFLGIENVINLVIGKVENEECKKSEAYLIQAGVRDLVLLSKSQDKISFDCVSAKSSQTMIRDLLVKNS